MDKDKRIKELEEELEKFKSSPYVDGYLGVLNQINTCNKDLDTKPAGLRDEADEKSFDRYNKYILAIDSYYQKLEILREKMSPTQVKVLDAKVQKSKTIAI